MPVLKAKLCPIKAPESDVYLHYLMRQGLAFVEFSEARQPFHVPGTNTVENLFSIIECCIFLRHWLAFANLLLVARKRITFAQLMKQSNKPRIAVRLFANRCALLMS